MNIPLITMKASVHWHFLGCLLFLMEMAKTIWLWEPNSAGMFTWSHQREKVNLDEPKKDRTSWLRLEATKNERNSCVPYQFCQDPGPEFTRATKGTFSWKDAVLELLVFCDGWMAGSWCWSLCGKRKAIRNSFALCCLVSWKRWIWALVVTTKLLQKFSLTWF